MEISSILQTTQASQVKKVNNNPYEEKENKQDYSNYSMSDLRDIPYSEAKENIELIKQRKDEIVNASNYKEEKKGEGFALTAQLSKIDYTNSDSTNESLYNTYQSIDEPVNTIMFHAELNENMKSYYNNGEINASFVRVNDSQNYSELNQAQINTIDFESFIDKMLETFTSDLNKSPNSTKKQYEQIVSGYSLLRDNYDSNVTKSFYA